MPAPSTFAIQSTPIATPSAVELLREEIEASMVMHSLAFQHFGSRQFWFFVIPQALLTLFSSILAFLSTSSVGRITTHGDTLATIVGCVSGIVVFLQTVASNRKYEERSTMHDVMATNLGGLKLHLRTLENRLNAQEESQQNQVGNQVLHEQPQMHAMAVHDNTFEFIATQLKEFDTGCKSRVPFPISTAFDALESKLKQHLFDLDTPERKERYQIRFRANDILSTQIVSHWRYPLFLPNAVKMVDQTMYLLVKDLNEKQKDLVEDLSYYRKALAYPEPILRVAARTETQSKRESSKASDSSLHDSSKEHDNSVASTPKTIERAIDTLA